MKNEQMVVVVQMKQFQGTYGEARNDRILPQHIWDKFERYKVELTNELPQEFPLRREKNYNNEVIPKFEPPCKAPYQLNQK